MSETDEGLRLRSGRVDVRERRRADRGKCRGAVRSRARTEAKAGYVAVDDKDGELQAIRAALESARSEAAADVKLAREEE